MPEKIHFWFPREPFSEKFLKEPFFKEPFSNIKIILCDGKAPWMLKFLQSTTDDNKCKEPSFLFNAVLPSLCFLVHG